MAAPELTWEHKVYIVRAFAALRTVSDILDTLQTIYGLRCKPDDILPFDASYRTLPPDLYQIHIQACRDFDDHPEKVVPLLSPIKQQAVIANAAQSCLRRGAIPDAAELIEQLAKLQGGYYSGRKGASKGDDAKSGTTDVNDVTPKMTAEQAAEAYASTLDGE